MKPIMRGYQNEEDYWRIRPFLREVFQLNGLREYSWHVARFDYWRWHMVETCGAAKSVDDAIFLWETEAGQLAAVLNADFQTEAMLTIHPDFHTSELEEEMIEIASTDGRRGLRQAGRAPGQAVHSPSGRQRPAHGVRLRGSHSGRAARPGDL